MRRASKAASRHPDRDGEPDAHETEQEDDAGRDCSSELNELERRVEVIEPEHEGERGEEWKQNQRKATHVRWRVASVVRLQSSGGLRTAARRRRDRSFHVVGRHLGIYDDRRRGLRVHTRRIRLRAGLAFVIALLSADFVE
jgi:hypothetical protein